MVFINEFIIIIQFIIIYQLLGCNGTVSYSEWSLCECLPSLNVTCGGNATRWRSIRNCSEPSCICAYEVEACNKPCPGNDFN